MISVWSLSAGGAPLSSYDVDVSSLHNPMDHECRRGAEIASLG